MTATLLAGASASTMATALTTSPAASSVLFPTQGDTAVKTSRLCGPPRTSGSGPTNRTTPALHQGSELFGAQRRRPAGQALHKRFEPAAEPGNPRFVGDPAVRDGGLQHRPAVVQGADGHLHRIVLAQRGTPGVVEQVVDDGVVEFRAGGEGPPGQRRRESQQVQPVGGTEVDVQDGVHQVLPFRGGVRMRAQGLLQGRQELLGCRQDGTGLRARQRGVVGPQRVAVQEGPEVVVEGGADSRLREFCQGALGAVSSASPASG